METIRVVREPRVHLQCRWSIYESLLMENTNASAPRLAYDRGVLEIMSPSLEHERITFVLGYIVERLADARQIDLLAAGATTYRRADLERGFEPDASFYLARAPLVRGAEILDLAIHPAPELVIEVDLSGSSMDKLPLYRALGVVEAWRYRGGQVEIHHLADNATSQESSLFPRLRADELVVLVDSNRREPAPDWRREVAALIQSIA